jgi:hypothetical protein|tara:strand:+ start:1477 stop:1767 length:291 start_codon:yes stop_codon:yes gene_type:complete
MAKSKLRGIIVLDIEVDNLQSADQFQKKLGMVAWGLQKPDLVEGIRITQVQHEVPLKTRRGRSGPIKDITIRGTRKPNKNGKNTKGNTLLRIYGGK